MINKVLCHETGCPDSWRDYTRECFTCGCDFHPEERYQCNCQDCIDGVDFQEEEHKYKVDQDGHQFWFQSGELHREDGPAIIWANGDQEWWINGKCHRKDGPAIIREDGSEEWCLNGESC